MTKRKNRLGLGDFLGGGGATFEGSLGDTDAPSPTTTTPVARTVSLDQLVRGTYQNRQISDDDPALGELAESIRQLGVIEPVVVRPVGGAFEILAGERRWRAARLAGLTEIPVVVREVDDREAAAITLVENLQRQDLNPMEEAEGLERLRSEFGLDQGQLAALLGRSQSAISRALGLLTLSDPVQNHLRLGRLQAGHAKPLQGLDNGDQIHLADAAVVAGWSVRELERQRERLLAARQSTDRTPRRDPGSQQLQDRLQARFGSPVRFKLDKQKGRGRIEIPFENLERCRAVLETLGIDPGELDD